MTKYLQRRVTHFVWLDVDCIVVDVPSGHGDLEVVGTKCDGPPIPANVRPPGADEEGRFRGPWGPRATLLPLARLSHPSDGCQGTSSRRSTWGSQPSEATVAWDRAARGTWGSAPDCTSDRSAWGS